MASIEDTYVNNHRRQHFMTLGVSLVFLLLAAAPRQERALFVTDSRGVKAFSANVSAIDFSSITRLPTDYLGGGRPTRAFFARTPGRPAAPGIIDDVPAVGGAAGAPFTPAAVDATPADGTGGPTVIAASAPVDGGGTFPFSPPALTPPSVSPAAPGLVAAATPIPAPSSPAVTATPTVPIAPAVPEPATWLMLIIGLAIVGAVLRRIGTPVRRKEASEITAVPAACP
ncbi:PEPxxWA-CTERM sorting domain-containing protein [uncultured Sphingomonas sp.]|uniref:PEPxxWA-CTERM sorting domain-containing protein n=1 Tax=uncultured Sphingomonas sp. TaxID=158754 RepID=UPI0035CA9857